MTLPKGLNLIEHKGQTLAKLYDTLIVETKPNAIFGTDITLNTGGWKTKHTKKCMNLVLKPFGVTVYQKNFIWYVKDSTNNITELIDGMTIKA